MIFTQEMIEEIKHRLSLAGIKDTEIRKVNLLENPIKGDETLVIVKDGENIRISLEDLYEDISKYIEDSENREDFFNVSVYLGRLIPGLEEGVQPCTLEEAINACPSYIRRVGETITFLDSDDKEWKTYQMSGLTISEWDDPLVWKNHHKILQDQIDEAISNQASINAAQEEINTNTGEALANRYTKEETYNKEQLNNLITTPDQQYVSVTATSQTTSVTDVLPSSGAANTIYRVGSWDGNMYDPAVYSEYSWEGNAYVLLSKKRAFIYDIEEDKGTVKNIQLKDGSENLLMPRVISDNVLIGSKFFKNDLSVSLPINVSGNTPSGGGIIFNGGNRTAVPGKYYFMVSKFKVNSLSKGTGVETAAFYVGPIKAGTTGTSITRTMLFHNSVVDPTNDEFYTIQCFTVNTSTNYIAGLVAALSPVNASNVATINIDIENFACFVVDSIDDVRLLSSYYYKSSNFDDKGIFVGSGDLQDYIDDEFENYVNNSEHVKVKALNFSYYGLDGLNTSENYACPPNLIKCGKNDKLRFINYGVNPAYGGGFALCYYPSNTPVDGTRVNGSDLTLISDGVYEWISPTDCYLGINNFVSANYAQEVFVEFYHEFANKTKIEPIDSKQVDLIIFMGQSNMAGRGITSVAHPEDAPNVIEGAGYEFRAITDPTKLYPLDKTFGLNENVSGAIDDGTMKTGGSVPSFVNSYFKQTYTPIICVSASEGGTAIDEWLPNTTRLNDAINRLTLCKNYLASNNYIIRHIYMAWCQGEHEGGTSMTKDTYKTNFLSMFDVMQNEGVEVCLMFQIGEYNGSTTSYIEGYRKIQQAQLELTQENSDIIMASDSFKLMKSRGLMKDDYHYYQEAYNIVGTQAGNNSGNFRSVTNSQIKDIFYIEI